MAMIEHVEDYFSKGRGRCDRFDTPECSAQHWRAGLLQLRDICRAAGLQEVVKWGHPCYMHADRNIAIIGAHRASYRLSFFDAALLKDPDQLLQRSGPNSKHADMFEFTCEEDVTSQRDVILAYLAEANSYAAAGVRPKKEVEALDLPEELIAALDADPVLAEAFHALTPGRQKSYVINLNGAKQSATRISRIAKFRDKIIAGKGALDR